MKETEWGRTIGTSCGSNSARYDRGAEPAVPAMMHGHMYHCTVQTKLNIEQTSVGFTHSHLITDTTISAQQQYHLSAMLVDKATEIFSNYMLNATYVASGFNYFTYIWCHDKCHVVFVLQKILPQLVLQEGRRLQVFL